MKLLDAKTNEELIGVVEEVSSAELKKLKKNKDFGFDWSKESKGIVYKICLENNDEILGLVSLINVPHEFRIHLNLIESARPYRGKNKKIKNVPGCLMAYACRESFSKGYDGFVSLVPKTELINYYANYGFSHFGNQMAVLGESSKFLIKKYF